MVLKDISKSPAGHHAAAQMLALVAILSLAACGASGVLAGTGENNAQDASFQNAIASTVCQPTAPSEPPQPGAGRRI